MSDPKLTSKTILSSYAIADTLSMLDDKLLITAGLRRQTIKSDSYDYDTTANLSHYSQSKNTPVAGIVYKPIKTYRCMRTISKACSKALRLPAPHLTVPRQQYW
jgi:iron complex outermembrane receptor protein